MKGARLTEARDGFFRLLFRLVQAESLEDWRRGNDPRRPIVCGAREVEELCFCAARSAEPSSFRVTSPWKKETENSRRVGEHEPGLLAAGSRDVWSI